MNRCLAGALLTVLCARVWASTPQDFAYGMPLLTSAPATAYKVSLPFAVYRDSSSDLADLRIFNAAGEEVAYTIMRHAEEAPVGGPKSLPLFPLRGDLQAATQGLKLTLESSDGAVQLQTPARAPQPGPIQQYIVDARALDTPVDRLTLSWPAPSADFSSRLRVEASDDFSSWRLVSAAAPLANLHAGAQELVENSVDLPAIKSKYWRLTWVASPPAVELTTLNARPASGPAEVRWDSRVVAASHAPKGGDYEFDIGARLPVEKINLSLPAVNSIYNAMLWSRDSPESPWRQIVQSGFYRLTTPQGEQRNSPIAVGLRRDRFWRVQILGDRSPSSAPQLEIFWSPADLEFLAQGTPPFMLAVGSSRAHDAESNLAVLPKSAVVLPASLGGQITLGGPSRVASVGATFPYQRPLLWGVLVAAVLFLAFMAVRLLKDSPPST